MTDGTVPALTATALKEAMMRYYQFMSFAYGVTTKRRR